MITNSHDLVEDENASTLSLLLIVIILAALVIGGYFFYTWVMDNGGWTLAGEVAGGGLWGALAGATSGFFGGAWKTGKDIGTKYNAGAWARKKWDKYF